MDSSPRATNTFGCVQWNPLSSSSLDTSRRISVRWITPHETPSLWSFAAAAIGKSCKDDEIKEERNHAGCFKQESVRGDERGLGPLREEERGCFQQPPPYMEEVLIMRKGRSSCCFEVLLCFYNEPIPTLAWPQRLGKYLLFRWNLFLMNSHFFFLLEWTYSYLGFILGILLEFM